MNSFYKIKKEDKINEFYLNNGLKIKLFNIDKLNGKGCILKVKNGSYFNKIDGLAHLTEHIIMHHNKEFTNNFKFLNGGREAYTYFFHQTYMFYINDLNDNNFRKLLKDFCNSFLNIKLDKEVINEEINSINTEYYLMYSKRHYDTLLNLNNKDKILENKETCGNKNSLSIKTIKEDLQEFINFYYVVENMELLIFDNDNLNNIKSKLKCFEQLPNFNKNLNKNSYYNQFNNYSSNIINLNSILEHKIYKVNTKTNNIINLCFSINNKYLNQDIINYLKYLLTRNSLNSFKNYMKKINILLNIIISNYQINYNFSYFVISIFYGNNFIDKENIILSYFYNYINFIKENFNLIDYNDFKKYTLNKFNINNNLNVQQIIKIFNSNYYKINDNYIFNDFSKNDLINFINSLNINNSLIIIDNFKNTNLNKYIKDKDIKYSIDNNEFKLNNLDNFKNLNLHINISNININKKKKTYKIEDIKHYNKNNLLIDYNKNIKNKNNCNIKIIFKINDIIKNINSYIYYNIYINILKDILYDYFYDYNYFLDFNLYINLINENIILIINCNNNYILKVLIDCFKILDYKINEELFNKYLINYFIQSNNLILSKIINEMFEYNFSNEDILKQKDKIKFNKSFKLNINSLKSIILCNDINIINNIKKLLISFCKDKIITNKLNSKYYNYNLNNLKDKYILSNNLKKIFIKKILFYF